MTIKVVNTKDLLNCIIDGVMVPVYKKLQLKLHHTMECVTYNNP